MLAGRMLFENERVQVCDLRLQPGEEHVVEHRWPTVRWQVEPGKHRLNGGESCEVKDKEVFFVEAGDSWHIVNDDKESEYRQITFALKQPPRRTEEETREILDNALYRTDVGTELLFENRLCRVWDFALGPGEGDPNDAHHHVLDYCFVYVAPGRLLGYYPDGKPGLFDSINEDGDVSWFDLPDGAGQDARHAHGGKNGYDDRPMREYLVELK